MPQPTRWIVTGGTGFLGTNFLHALTASQDNVVVIARHAPRWPVVSPHVRYLEQDVREVASYQDEITPGSVVVHLASSTYPGKAEKAIESDIQDNVLTAIRLAHLCHERGVKRLIFLSSGGSVYGPTEVSPIHEQVLPQPITAYGVMKLTVEHYLRMIHLLTGLPVTILRAGNPYGPWHRGYGQGAINVFLSHLHQKKSIEIWGDGQQVRDYLAVEDVAEAMRLAGDAASDGFHLYNVGTGVGRSLLDVLVSLERITGLKPDVRFQPARGIDVVSNILEASLIRKDLGWQARQNWDEALKRTWEWIQLYG